MVAPALHNMATDLGISTDVASQLQLAIYVLALGLGPLLFGPLSEIYGRVRVMRYSNLMFLAFNLGCGFAQTSSQMLALRFFAGLCGSAPLAVSLSSVLPIAWRVTLLMVVANSWDYISWEVG